MRWRIEQAQEFREEVERYTDAERVILADVLARLILDTFGPWADLVRCSRQRRPEEAT